LSQQISKSKVPKGPETPSWWLAISQCWAIVEHLSA